MKSTNDILTMANTSISEAGDTEHCEGIYKEIENNINNLF
jgi:hypothetical protein